MMISTTASSIESRDLTSPIGTCISPFRPPFCSETDIVQSIRTGDLETLKSILASNPKNQEIWEKPFGKSGISVSYKALLLSIGKRNITLVRMLLTSGIIKNLGEKTCFGDEAIHYAAKHGCLQVFQCLAEDTRCDLNATNNLGWSPLFIAAARGNFSILKYLMEDREMSHHINNRDYAGETILHVACVSGNAKVVSYLLDQCGCDGDQNEYISSKSLFSDFTAMDYAAFTEHFELVELLKERFPHHQVRSDIVAYFVLEQAIQNSDLNKIKQMAKGRESLLRYHFYDAVLQGDTETANLIAATNLVGNPFTIRDFYGRGLLDISGIILNRPKKESGDRFHKRSQKFHNLKEFMSLLSE